jgi:hypothetical protein
MIRFRTSWDRLALSLERTPVDFGGCVVENGDT